MISISLQAALLLYLTITLSFVLLVWTIFHFQTRKKIPLPSRTTLVTCEYCAHVFLAITGDINARCPQCGSYSSRD